MKDEVILRSVGDLVVPFVLLDGVYVITHGEGGPGGGFQGGVIIAAAFVLHGLLHGMESLRRVVSRRLTVTLATLGVLTYVLVGVTGMVAGEAFLDHGGLAADPVRGQVLGITLIECGVGLTVAGVMLTICDELMGS